MELNESQLSLIARANPGDFAIYKLEDGKITTFFASSGLPAISGMTAEEYREITDEDAANIILDNDRPVVASLLTRFLVDHKDIDFTYRILHRTKGSVWVHACVRWLGTLDGCPVIMSTFMRSSEESEEHEFLLNHSVAGIYVVDIDSRELLFANESALQNWNRGSNYSGSICHRFVQGLDTVCPWCPLSHLENGVAHVDSCYVPPLDKWFRIDARAMNWFGHRAVAVSAVDITHRVRRQQNLELDKKNLKELIDSMPGGIGLMHECNGVFFLDYANSGYCRIHHGTWEYCQRFSGANLFNIVYKPDRALIKTEYDRVRDIPDAQGGITYRIYGEDGQLHWVDIQFRRAYCKDGIQYYYASFADMDKQKETEEKLAESQSALHEAMANSDLQFFTYYPGKHRCEIFAVSNRLKGLPSVWEDFPDSFLKYTGASQEDAESYRQMLHQIDTGAEEAECTVRFAHKNVWTWEKMHIKAIRDSEGHTIRAQGYSINVNAQKRTETRFREEQMRLKSLADGMVEAFSFNINKNGQPQLQSSESINYSQPLQDDLVAEATAIAPPLGSPEAKTRQIMLGVASQIPDRADRELFLKTCSGNGVRQACSEGRFKQTIEYRRKIGNVVRWVSTVVDILPDPESGDLIAFFYTWDINDTVVRRKINARMTAENYETVSAYDMQTGTLSVGSVGTGSALSFQSVPYQEALDRIIAGAVSEDADKLRCKLNLESVVSTLAHAPVFTVYYAEQKSDDTLPGHPRRRIKTDAFYLDDNRDVIVFLQTNVTQIFEMDRDHREKMAAALVAAEQASVAKTEFLSRMSHEIRTPMNAIIGLDAIALQEKGLSSALEDHLHKIGISARFLLSLINDILDMSRIESGRMMLKKESFSFEDLINSVNTILYEQCRSSGLSYECVLKSFTEEYYIGDKTKLQQILVNILGNAVKFTPRGGRVVFSIEQMVRSAERARLRFTVTDTGIGIDKDFLPHMFEPFSQEDRGRTSAYGGTGLGLAISRNIARLMGGTIDVHSIKGVGSEFTVEVELGLTAETIRARRMGGPVKLTPLFTLIVDDNIVVCQHTQMILNESGLKAEWVDSGTAAVEKVTENHRHRHDYDLILLDWQMPGMDGIETARRIRRIVGPEVTIIIMTAFDWSDIEESALAAGVDMFMKKPLFASAVTSAFTRATRHRGEEIKPEPEPDYDFSGKRVLLAEDNEINAEIARNLLEMKGFTVDTADNGATAIEAFTSKPVGTYDVILMDVRMPIMDGLEATRTIRAMKKADSRTIPIIAMTANAFQEDVNMSLSSGMNAHLAKPIEPELLYQTLARFLKKKE